MVAGYVERAVEPSGEISVSSSTAGRDNSV
jgi:hypothetical protein